MLLKAPTTLAALTGCVLLLGCTPKLEDGTYGCNTGPCPDNWYCHSDHRCYSTPETDAGGAGADGHDGADGNGNDGNDGAGKGDAGGGAGGDGQGGGTDGGGGNPSGAAGYASCDAPADCKSGVCSGGPDTTAQHRVCSESCSTDGECVLDGRAGSCVIQSCLPGCDTDAECTAPSRCYQAAVGPNQFKRACFEVSNPALQGTTTCTPENMTSCPRIGACAFNPMLDANGLCSMRCDDDGACPGDGRCVEVFSGIHHCMKTCQSNAECGGTFKCGSFGAGASVCLPAGWSGQTPPLPMPPMM